MKNSENIDINALNSFKTITQTKYQQISILINKSKIQDKPKTKERVLKEVKIKDNINTNTNNTSKYSNNFNQKQYEEDKMNEIRKLKIEKESKNLSKIAKVLFYTNDKELSNNISINSKNLNILSNFQHHLAQIDKDNLSSEDNETNLLINNNSCNASLIKLSNTNKGNVITNKIIIVTDIQISKDIQSIYFRFKDDNEMEKGKENDKVHNNIMNDKSKEKYVSKKLIINKLNAIDKNTMNNNTMNTNTLDNNTIDYEITNTNSKTDTKNNTTTNTFDNYFRINKEYNVNLKLLRKCKISNIEYYILIPDETK